MPEHASIDAWPGVPAFHGRSVEPTYDPPSVMCQAGLATAFDYDPTITRIIGICPSCHYLYPVTTDGRVERHEQRLA
jgi:hypothetical protein